MFAVIDTDSSKSITFDEFKNKTRMLNIGLEDLEVKALFQNIDANNNGTITYDEFVNQFKQINTL